MNLSQSELKMIETMTMAVMNHYHLELIAAGVQSKVKHEDCDDQFMHNFLEGASSGAALAIRHGLLLSKEDPDDEPHDRIDG